MTSITPSDLEPELAQETWTTLPNLPLLTGSTVLNIGPRRLFAHSPTTILKIGVDDGEDIMTAVAHSMLGACVPRVISVVTIQTSPSVLKGIILTRQPGTPLVELWPSLSVSQRAAIKSELCDLLLRMRAGRFDYYGRPSRRPYIIDSDVGPVTHAYCMSRSEWDESRIRALQVSQTAPSKDRMLALEKVQRETNGANNWDRPVLTHGDLSDRNILVDPNTLTITGLIDWETAGFLPAYFEYVAARLSGGHEPEWRAELLDVLKMVLRRECEGSVEDAADSEGVGPNVAAEERYRRTMAAWDAVVDVERFAQGYNDNCHWTFETGPRPEGYRFAS